MKLLDLEGLRHLLGRITPELKDIDRRKADKTLRPVVLQRGIISINARRGVVYRNLGWIRVPLRLKHHDAEWDCGDFYAGEVSVDGVAWDYVEGVELKYNGHEECGASERHWANGSYISLSKAKETVSFRLRKSFFDRSASLRLRIGSHVSGSVAPYIYRGGDGVIRAGDVPMAVVDPTAEAPCIPPDNIGVVCENCDNPLHGALKKLLGSGKFEVQLKKKTPTIFYGGGRKVKWRRRSKERIAEDKPLWNASRGVARVRYRKNNRRPASQWTVFSFKASSERVVMLQRL